MVHTMKRTDSSQSQLLILLMGNPLLCSWFASILYTFSFVIIRLYTIVVYNCFIFTQNVAKPRNFVRTVCYNVGRITSYILQFQENSIIFAMTKSRYDLIYSENHSICGMSLSHKFNLTAYHVISDKDSREFHNDACPYWKNNMWDGHVI